MRPPTATPTPNPSPQGGGERTEYAAKTPHLVSSRTAVQCHSPRHPCEITGNLGLRVERSRAPPALCLIGDTKKPSPTRGDDRHDLDLPAAAGGCPHQPLPRHLRPHGGRPAARA